MTIYYVSSGNGNDSNTGTATGAAFATLQAAADKTKLGDTVEVMNGTYANPQGGGAVVNISQSGTSTAPITFEAAAGQHPIIDSSGNWSGIAINGASYVTVQGFEIVGGAKSITLAQAQSQSTNTSDPTTNGDGIDIQPGSAGAIPNHITVQNNTVHDEPGGGIVSMNADYVSILNNTTYGNANWSPYAASGISLGFSTNYDNAPGVHDIVSGNTSYDNTELIPFHQTGTITDGEGIIIDSNNLNGYTGQIMVQNNITYGNSGPGIEDFNSNNVTITGNAAYGNTTNAVLASEGQISISQSTGSTSTNNSNTAPTSFGASAPTASSTTPASASASVMPASSTGSASSATSLPPVSSAASDATLSPDRLVLQLSQARSGGDAQFIVKMDGTQLGGPTSVSALHSAGQTDTFSYAGNWGSGTHNVEVDFIKDKYSGTPATGRDLYIDQVVYNGTASLSTPTELTSNGVFGLHVGSTS